MEFWSGTRNRKVAPVYKIFRQLAAGKSGYPSAEVARYLECEKTDLGL